MAVSLNHTIVAARDQHESARFLSEILGSDRSLSLRQAQGTKRQEPGESRKAS